MGRPPIRVLLIEDEESDYLLARRMLASSEGQTFDLEWASNWQAGIEAIRRRAHDVCLLDFRIGGGDGLELLKESRDAGCKAPVIILTGIGDYRLDVEAMELGAADFIVKHELTPALLERSIRYAIAQAKTVEQLQLQRDDLRASELRFRSVVESAPDAIVLADEEARIVSWNKGAETIFGYSEDEVIGSRLEILIPEIYQERRRGGLERFRVTGKSSVVGKTVQLEGLRKDGTLFPLELSLASWRHGDRIMFSAIIRDMTEPHRIDDLRRAKEAAEEANKAKSAFVARMSHELRTPLHAIIGFTNLLLQNKNEHLTAQAIDFLERVLSNAKDQLSLINDILDLSKVEAGRMDAQMGQASLDLIVQEVVKQFEGNYRNPSVRVETRFPEAIRPVETDARKFKQILVNLVDNALKFTDQGTVTIEIHVDSPDLQPVRIDITDTGSDIPEQQLQEVFEPFHQLDRKANQRAGGTGLGLSICRSLCDLLGYRLEVRSRLGHGSTFSVVLKDNERQGIQSLVA